MTPTSANDSLTLLRYHYHKLKPIYSPFLSFVSVSILDRDSVDLGFSEGSG